MTDGMIDALHYEGTDWDIQAGELAPSLLEDLLDCGAPGQPADGAVDYVMRTYKVTGVPEDCRNMLRPYGAWEDDELQDHDENLRRLVWMTGCDLRETGDAYFSGY